MTQPLRFLIVDGYPKASREQFHEVGMKLAGELYENLALKHVPDAETTIWISSDEDSPPVPTVEDLDQYDGVLWPGCNLTVYHDDPRVHKHIQLADRAYEAGVPQFGSCWAIQLATVVAGGEVGVCKNGREMGVGTKVRLTEAGKRHPMFEGKPQVYNHFMSHDDEVIRLPEGGTWLAGNDWSPVQAAEIRYKQGVFWAVQYHPEYDLHELARLITAREERLIKFGYFQDHDDLAAYVSRLDALVADPTRKDLRWQLKIDDDVLDDNIRECEFRNWIKHLVMPTAAARRAGEAATA
jgi:GMP synthase (glutamine-hydrolysing)